MKVQKKGGALWIDWMGQTLERIESIKLLNTRRAVRAEGTLCSFGEKGRPGRTGQESRKLNVLCTSKFLCSISENSKQFQESLSIENFSARSFGMPTTRRELFNKTQPFKNKNSELLFWKLARTWCRWWIYQKVTLSGQNVICFWLIGLFWMCKQRGETGHLVRLCWSLSLDQSCWVNNVFFWRF